jgi:exportin-2 (importin alpha re-exporter)
MRVTGRVAEILAEQNTVSQQMFWAVLNQLLNKLSLVFKNPTNPLYVHFLHESLALMINAAARRDPQLLKQVETNLFPVFQVTFKEDIVDMQPYELQLMAMLLERSPSNFGMQTEYNELLQGFVSPVMWERKGNIPGMARLLVQYLRLSPQLILANDAFFFKAILGVFQKLIASKLQDVHGFVLLEGIITYLEPHIFQSYLVDIFKLLFTRLQRSKTPKFIEYFLVWLCRCILKHGPTFVLEHLNSVQTKYPSFHFCLLVFCYSSALFFNTRSEHLSIDLSIYSIFLPLLTEVCLPNLNRTSGKYNRQVCALGLTKILTEWPPMLNEPYLQVWPLLLEKVIVLLEEDEPDKNMQEQDITQPYLNFEEDTNFASTYSRLVYATKPNDEIYKNVEPRQVLARALGPLLAQFPDKIRSLLQKLNPLYTQHLQRYLTSVDIKGVLST